MSKAYTPSKSSSILNEPVAVYGQANYYTLAQQSISKDYIKHVLNVSKLSINELIGIIPISIDTYKRKNQFNSNVTEKVLEIEQVYNTGLKAFGEGFHHWMNTKNVAIGGIIPKTLLSNSFGIRRLIDEIGRMEHGVLA